MIFNLTINRKGFIIPTFVVLRVQTYMYMFTQPYNTQSLLSVTQRYWSNQARTYFFTDPDNRDGLGMIERSSFVLCLDKSIPLSWNHQSSIDETRMSIRDDVSLASQMLHGQGSKINSSNRWFDKTMQVQML